MLVGADAPKMVQVGEALLALSRGWYQEHVASIVRETLDEVVTPIIFAEAVELIAEHQAAGRKIVIVSSSPFEVVQPLAEHLGADEAIATRAELDESGNYTGELSFYAYGSSKAVALREIARRDGIDLTESYAYSDSVTDLPMLETVGHPVAVNPDRDLARIARDRGWEMLHFRRPVRLRDRVPAPPPGPTIAVSTVVLAASAGAAAWWWMRRRSADGAAANGGAASDRSRAHRARRTAHRARLVVQSGTEIARSTASAAAAIRRVAGAWSSE
jgi:HAD superfamily hydrolase (TIGR01490 family)